MLLSQRLCLTKQAIFYDAMLIVELQAGPWTFIVIVPSGTKPLQLYPAFVHWSMDLLTEKAATLEHDTNWGLLFV